jgi:PST family polysaccharide transporter
LEFFKIGAINLIALVLSVAAAIILALQGYGYYAIIARAVLVSIVTFVLSLILCKTSYKIEFDTSVIRGIFSFSGWLMASALFRNLAHQIDKLMMPRLLSVNALGAYNRPKDFVESISTRLNGIFDSALFPVLSGVQDKKDVLRSAFRRSLSLMNIFALMLTLAFFFNSRLIIRIFFGMQWLDLKVVMMVISCSLLFNIDGRLADCFLRSLAMTKQQFFFRIFETVLKIIGVLIGFKWGVLGVASSIVITNFISKLVKILFVSRKLDIECKECCRLIVSFWRFAIIIIIVCGISM